MNIIINNKEILIKRLNKWIEEMEYILKHRRDLFWGIYEEVQGKVVTHSLKWSKDLFKTNSIDRHKKALEAIETNNLHSIDWIDYRDVLYYVCFDIDMLGLNSFEKLRQSNQDLIINCSGDTKKFEGFIGTNKQFI